MPGSIKNLTGYFSVPKVQGDIRVVYDANECGLNKDPCLSNFLLLNIYYVIRNTYTDMLLSGINIGYIFVN